MRRDSAMEDDQQIITLLPPPGQIQYEQYGPVINAKEEIEDLQLEADVDVFDDPELEVLAEKFEGKVTQVVEVNGSSACLKFPCLCDLPQLVMHFKHLKAFTKVEVEVVCSDKTRVMMIFRNNTTIARIKHDVAELHFPLELVEGWNYLLFDLDDLLQSALGKRLARTTSVVVFGTCRLWRIYFQGEEYADAVLPVELQVF